MFSPKLSAAWQQVAHRVLGHDSGFAIGNPLGNSSPVSALLSSGNRSGQDCYPFPSPWSGPVWVGPFFQRSKRALGPKGAICVKRRFFRFDFSWLAVESASITTNNRGRIKTCVKQSSFFHCFQCRLLAACRTLRRAVLPVRRLGRRLPILPITARLRVRLSAVWPVRPLAALTWVCRPATDLIRRARLAPAVLNKRSSGIFPGWPFFVVRCPAFHPMFGV